MEFNKIISITGKPGLYEILTQSKNGVIVTSLSDGKRFPITQTHNVSSLENIAIYTFEEEIPLLKVFKTMSEKSEGKETISHKENSKVLTKYFSEVLPDYDDERVYVSNIKKVVQWFNLLIKAGFDFSAVVETEENTSEEA